VRLLTAALLLLQDGATPPWSERPELRAGLDTLYGGGFPSAAAYFAALGAKDTSDPAPPVFEASAYIWWAAALEDEDYEARRIDALLDRAVKRAAAGPRGPVRDFWLAAALGYRARERDIRGSSWEAEQDGKAMRDDYARVLAADSA